MPILAASCIGRSAKQYAKGVFVGKVLGVIPLAYSELLNRQKAFLSLCKIHRITLSSSHRHGKTCDKEYTAFFRFLHFSLPYDATAALKIFGRHAFRIVANHRLVLKRICQYHRPAIVRSFRTGHRYRLVGISTKTPQ